MPARASHLSFILSSFEFKKDVQRIITAFQDELNKLGFHLMPIEKHPNIAFFVPFFTNNGSHAILRGEYCGLITLDIHEYFNQLLPSLDQKTVENLGNKICEILNCTNYVSLPQLKYGDEINQYYPTVDNRLMQLDIEEKVFDQKSKYQNIEIVKSSTLGNILILDGDLNLGESDMIYTHTLMQKGREDYRGRECLILGGGDGGLLSELLKEQPAMVIMVEIDELVMNACSKHLRTVCSDVLDNMQGRNYQIIIGDALKLLDEYVCKSRKFDYVFYDLTAIPINSEEHNDELDFFNITLKLSLKVLNKYGKYFCQVNSTSARNSIAMLENMLLQYQPNVKFKKHSAFIPSFHETWTFFEIWKA